jgi:hypothetical protein
MEWGTEMGSQIWSISITSTTKQQNDDNHHASVTTAPYCAGNSLTSMSGISSFPIVRGPWPTTFILASVAGDKIGLNSQKIHVMIERTLTKEFACLGQTVRVTGRWEAI